MLNNFFKMFCFNNSNLYYFLKFEGFKFDLGDYNMWEEIEDLKFVFGELSEWLSSWFFFTENLMCCFKSIIFVLFNIYYYLFFNVYFLFIVSLLFLLIISRKGLNNIFIIDHFVYKNKGSVAYYFVFNIFLLLMSILYYFNNFVLNIYDYKSIFYIKKIKVINFNIDLIINLDYISIYFIILTTFIFSIIYFTFINLKFKKDIILRNIKTILFFFLIIEFFLILTFSSSNIFFFFLFFESSLVPLYCLITILGGGIKKKQYANILLVFYTLFGSIFLLLGILYMLISSNSCDLKNINFEYLDAEMQTFLFILFIIGFSVKIPMFPFFSWLPEAHVEASTSISILLAAIFLKVATYGLLKIVIFNFVHVNEFFYTFIFILCTLSIFLATFISIIQTDLKKIIALSSIIHMNYMIISMFSLNSKVIMASLIYMFSHAFVSSGLFYLIGVLYENNGTRDLLNFSRASIYNSKFFIFFIFFNLSNISFPLTISFIAELMLLNNLAISESYILIPILISIIFSVIYTFTIIHNVLFGKSFLKKNSFFFNKFDLFFIMSLTLIIFILGILPFIVFFNIEQEIYLILVKHQAIVDKQITIY